MWVWLCARRLAGFLQTVLRDLHSRRPSSIDDEIRRGWHNRITKHALSWQAVLQSYRRSIGLGQRIEVLGDRSEDKPIQRHLA